MPPRRLLFLMPLLISLLSAALLSLPSAAQAWDWSWPGAGQTRVGSGQVVDEARNVAAFSRIRLEGPFELQASQTSRPFVVVRADDNLASMVTTEVEGDTLVIRPRPGYSLRSHQPLRVTVGADRLASVDLRGSGDVLIQGLKGDRFELQLWGSGQAGLRELALQSLVVNLAGSGDVTAQGHCNEARLSLAGSGNLHMAELQTLRTSVSVAGSGDARVHTTQALQAQVAGSGDVRYSGEPASVKSNVAGSGSIHAVR